MRNADAGDDHRPQADDAQCDDSSDTCDSTLAIMNAMMKPEEPVQRLSTRVKIAADARKPRSVDLDVALDFSSIRS